MPKVEPAGNTMPFPEMNASLWKQFFGCACLAIPNLPILKTVDFAETEIYFLIIHKNLKTAAFALIMGNSQISSKSAKGSAFGADGSEDLRSLQSLPFWEIPINQTRILSLLSLQFSELVSIAYALKWTSCKRLLFFSTKLFISISLVHNFPLRLYATEESENV